jgi:hypothetical protein
MRIVEEEIENEDELPLGSSNDGSKFRSILSIFFCGASTLEFIVEGVFFLA